MQMIIPNSLSAWLIVSCVVFMFVLCFGHKIFHTLKKANHIHHFLVWNDNSIDSIYDWDDEDDMI